MDYTFEMDNAGNMIITSSNGHVQRTSLSEIDAQIEETRRSYRPSLWTRIKRWIGR